MPLTLCFRLLKPVACRVTASAALVVATANRDRDDAMADATARPDTATTTPIECTLPTIIADYEQIDAYLTETGAPDEIGEALGRITCLAQHAQGIQSAIQQLQQAVQKQAQPAPSGMFLKSCMSSVDIVTFSVIIGCEGNIDMKNGSGGFYPAIL